MFPQLRTVFPASSIASAWRVLLIWDTFEIPGLCGSWLSLFVKALLLRVFWVISARLDCVVVRCRTSQFSRAFVPWMTSSYSVVSPFGETYCFPHRAVVFSLEWCVLYIIRMGLNPDSKKCLSSARCKAREKSGLLLQVWLFHDLQNLNRENF